MLMQTISADLLPREKLIHSGADTLTDAELLAIFLRIGIQGKSVIQLAEELIQQFGGLHQLLSADQQAFCEAKGLGPAKYAQVKASLEMSRRFFEQAMQKGESFNSPELTASYFTHQIGHKQREVFGCMLLNQQNQMIHFEIVFKGTINQASIYPRELVKLAIKHNAAAAIICHNHPSGNPKPSDSDFKITQKIKEAFTLIDVLLLDHIIIGDSGRWHSMAKYRQL